MFQAKSNRDFRPLHKSKTDASPVAINVLKSEAKIEIMRKAWELRTRKLVERLGNHGLKRIGIIGKNVYRVVSKDVKRLDLPVEIFDQPNFNTRERRWELLSRYYQFCHGST
jgi:hypothetical protein